MVAPCCEFKFKLPDSAKSCGARDSSTLAEHNVTNPVLVTQKAWHFHGKFNAAPFAGMGSFIQCVNGLFFVTCVDIAKIIDVNFHLVTLADFLETQDITKHSSAILGEGSAIWCPPGHIPIAMAIGPETEKLDTLKYSCFAQYVSTEPKQAASLEPIVAIEVRGWIEQALAKNMKVFEDTADDVKKWFGSLPKLERSPVKAKDDSENDLEKG